MIGLLIIDIDGVMTDGTKSYDNQGNISHKSFCDLDFTAINRFKQYGVSVCFLSADKNINENMAKNRKIDFFYSRKDDGSINKLEMLDVILKVYDKILSETMYVGDDIFDIEIMKKVTYSFCPRNSPEDVKLSVWSVLNRDSGKGLIAELFDYCISHDFLDKSLFDENKKLTFGL